jgi:hypothetical protein
MEVKYLDNLQEPMPYEWNVAFYWDDTRQEYCLQVIKRKGTQLDSVHWLPSIELFYSFSQYELGAIDAVIYPKQATIKVFSAGKIANFMDNYSPLKPLAQKIREVARIN